MLQKSLDSAPLLPIQTLIKQWLQLRQTVLIQYNELCIKSHQNALKRVNIFCQNLMDYVSMGHFKMFEKLAEQYELNTAYSKGLNKDLLFKITGTTETILNFNDKYTEPKNLNTLAADLSAIGETLANRMDWEDQLIKSVTPRYIKK